MTKDLTPAPALVRPTIPMRYLAEMAERARGGHAPVERALAEAGLPPQALGLTRLRASVVQLERFYAALARASGDELFGYFERPVPPGVYAALVRLLTGCADVASALDACARFYRVFDRHPYWELRVDRARATLTLSPRDARQGRSVFFVHSMLLTPWRTAAWLAARSLPLEEVTLPPRLRRFRAEARYLFGREPRFHEGLPQIAFAADLARLPVARVPGDADAYARTSLRAMLLPAGPDTVEQRLRGLLAPSFDLDVAQAARTLGLSRATLARKLAREGTSFQRVKDDLRRDQAIALLTATPLGLSEVARRLGYSAQSAFQRAFREWTGVAPGAFRRP